MVGTIPQKEDCQGAIDDLIKEKQTLKSKTGRTVKWTETKQEKLEKLQKIQNAPLFDLLPKTMKSELRKIHRSETYGRNFSFTNKYVEKGLSQEQEAITVYQKYRKEVLGESGFFRNNKDRLSNDYTSGEADLCDNNDFATCTEGFDIKCSWELETFPFKEDKLDFAYECQNQDYMWLSGAKIWTTAYVLVNITEDLLNKEKLRWFYALGSPDESNENEYEQYQNFIDKCKELETRYIFDYDSFIEKNPGHIMEISRSEWHEKGLDIPLEYRVIEKTVEYDQSLIDKFIERIEISREYLKHLDEN